MSDIDEMLAWLRDALDEDEQWALAASAPYQYGDGNPTTPPEGVHWEWVAGDDWDPVAPDPVTSELVADGDRVWLASREEWPSRSPDRLLRRTVIDAEEVDSSAGGHIIRHDPARVLREVEAKREMLTEHAPQLQTVEWDHDQNGKGEALCCPRCQNAEHSEWNPPVGRARGLPEGFVTPYVLAPCHTLRLLALPYSDRLGYQEEWRP